MRYIYCVTGDVNEYQKDCWKRIVFQMTGLPPVDFYESSFGNNIFGTRRIVVIDTIDQLNMAKNIVLSNYYSYDRMYHGRAHDKVRCDFLAFSKDHNVDDNRRIKVLNYEPVVGSFNVECGTCIKP